ncbi:hypothetical protein DMUE_3176 [Dictyocoela muelleri]|nr:hypothetical protein DMUE_3176 [Dictyocoela muelleri]
MKHNPIQLGGEVIVCHVDESCFSVRQKDHFGRTISQILILGIVDTSSVPSKSFMVPVERRNATNLLPIISRVCKLGSIIHTDIWAAYDGLSLLGFRHHTVCHRRNFINPADGTHTQNIESLWSKAKYRIRKMRGVLKNNLNDVLSEFMWRDISLL